MLKKMKKLNHMKVIKKSLPVTNKCKKLKKRLIMDIKKLKSTRLSQRSPTQMTLKRT
jgi:hypothetical protein